MSSVLTIEYFRSQGLLPFQAEFARDFCASQSPPFWELVAPVGTGKTFLAGVLTSCEIESGARRILFLAPRALVPTWEHVFRSAVRDVTPLTVDRRKFLELTATTPTGRDPWPAPSLIIMSLDLAKRNDLASSLSSVDWDLVVIDESHLLTGRRRDLVERLMHEGHVRRALLLTATPIEPMKDINRRLFNRQELLDWDSNPLFKAPMRRLVSLEYERAAEERVLLQDFERFADTFQQRTEVGRLQAPVLLRAASSSIFTLESVMRRLWQSWRPIRNRIAHGMDITIDDLKQSQRLLGSAVDEVEFRELTGHATIRPHDLLSLYHVLEQLLDRIDEIPSDSKLEALSGHITKIWSDRAKKHLCVWTSFLTTVQYVASSLVDLDIPLFLLTSDVDAETRKHKVEAFRENGGILLTTDVAAEEGVGGFALDYVDECLNYDLPESPDKFEQRRGRFDRYGRTTDFEMVWLRDRSKSLAWEERTLQLLEQTS